MAEAVRAAIDELPSAYRDVLVLRELEQLEYEVIALRLQIPIGTVRSRLNRSRDEIHRKLKSRLRVLEHPAVVSSFQEPERSPRPKRGARA